MFSAVRHVLKVDFHVTPQLEAPRPVGPLLRFDTSDGAFYVGIIREPDHSVRAFGIARR